MEKVIKTVVYFTFSSFYSSTYSSYYLFHFIIIIFHPLFATTINAVLKLLNENKKKEKKHRQIFTLSNLLF